MSQDLTSEVFFTVTESNGQNFNSKKLKRPLSEVEIKNAYVSSNSQNEEMTSNH